jgi:hypothetical protein
MEVSANVQTVLAGISIGLLVFYVMKRMRYRLPPGPWGIPLVGSYSGHFPTLGDLGHRYEISIWIFCHLSRKSILLHWRIQRGRGGGFRENGIYIIFRLSYWANWNVKDKKMSFIQNLQGLPCLAGPLLLNLVHCILNCHKKDTLCKY